MENFKFRSLSGIALIFISLAVFGQQKETRDVDTFSAISLGIAGELYFTQGSPRKVVIEADENSLGKIITEVKDGVLKIKQENGWNQNLKNVTIWVTLPEIEGLYLAGSGSMLAEKTINSEEIELKVSGSGNIKIQELKAGEIGIAVSGSGNINLGGSAEEMDIAISGSGNVKTGDLEVDECSVRISGSGNCVVNVTGELDAKISGSGGVSYFGSPEVDVTISGSGKVKKAVN